MLSNFEVSWTISGQRGQQEAMYSEMHNLNLLWCVERMASSEALTLFVDCLTVWDNSLIARPMPRALEGKARGFQFLLISSG